MLRDMLDMLHEECAEYEKLGNCVILGDLNARTNDHLDFICYDETDDFLPLDNNYVPDNTLDKRVTQDHGNVNSSRKDLLVFCKSSGLQIVNGRVNKGNSGNFMCFNTKGSSIVHYVLAKEEVFENFGDSIVGNVNEFSDHVPIHVSIKMNQNTGPLHALVSENNKAFDISATDPLENLRDNYAVHFVLDDATAERIESALNNNQVKEFLSLIREELNNPGVPVEVSVAKLRSKLSEISESTILSKKPFKNANKKNGCRRACPWFDEECKLEKNLLNRARKAYQFALKNDSKLHKVSLRDNFFSQKKRYHKILKSKRKIYNENRREKLWNLKSFSPNEFWKMLGGQNKPSTIDFDKNTLFDYFNDLLSTNETHNLLPEAEEIVEQNQIDEYMGNLINDSLNCKITLEEVVTMIGKLNTGKASGIDLITAELLKGLDESFLIVFTKLFNKIFDHGEFPEEWAVGIIVLLFKGGDKSDLDNFQGITLLRIFGKLSLGILLERLTTMLNNFKILEDNQIAYRKGYQTSDHLFTFISIIQNAFNQNNSNLYFCFVDFKKAFHSVDHSLLMEKSLAKGISGTFYKILSTLYAKVKSCARAKDGLSNFFSCSRGVRQGCVLSPMLFALFLNDLNAAISSKAKGISLGSDVVHTLLYADDLVLVAETPEDLQTQLDILKVFTDDIKMKVNIGKTKVMVLRKNKRKSQSQNTWLLGEQELQECDSYKYLGVTIKSNGSFNEHIENIKLKAGKAYYALISKCKDFNGLQPSLFLYLFNQTIVPIMNYPSEIWGFDEHATLERLHLSVCKYILGVKSTTCTDAVYAELGRISLHSNRHVCMLNFFARLQLLNVSEPHRLACKSFHSLCEAADLGCINWISRVRELQARYDILPSDNVSAIKSKVRCFFENSTLSTE